MFAKLAMTSKGARKKLSDLSEIFELTFVTEHTYWALQVEDSLGIFITHLKLRDEFFGVRSESLRHLVLRCPKLRTVEIEPYKDQGILGLGLY